MNPKSLNYTSLRIRLAIYFMFLCVLITALIIGILYYNFKLELREELKNRLASIISIAVIQQDRDTILKITSADDENYKKIKEQNLKTRESDPDLVYVYTMLKNEQGIYFVVDTNMPGDKEVSAFGKPYLEPDALLVDTIIGPDFYTNEYGMFLSAYAPIYALTGEKIGVLGIDITANKVIARERRFLTTSLGIFAASLPIIVLLGFLLGGIIVAPILKLTKTAERITAGDLNAKAAVGTKDEIGRLAAAFNTMTIRLQELVNTLEQRVTERTTELALANQETQKRSSELQVITEIAQNIALAQNIDDLLPLITGLISERFGFYHVGIFLLDEARENAVLQAANSTGGQRMLAHKHQLKLGSTSIVGFASQTGRARVALDVGADISYFDNPDLPDTHSEVALPLKIGDRVIGVLDVQSTETAAFKEDELGILTTLANQVAVAIQNARLYHEARTAFPERRKTPRKKFALSPQSAAGFTYAPDGAIKPIPAIPADNASNNASNQTIILDAASGASAPTLHVPVKLRDQIVGFLNIQSNDPNRNWSEDEIALVQTISERAAFALENAHLFESATRRADQEETVARITSSIGASTDFNHILQTTIQELSHSLNANRAYIQLGIADRDANE
ncbi:MAG: GAF domain-containing protein [Anaerolineales bacterium]|nr:GAF domain-containing protein [Anaerolineales bacterium]